MTPSWGRVIELNLNFYLNWDFQSKALHFWVFSPD